MISKISIRQRGAAGEALPMAKTKPSQSDSKLLYASTGQSADMLYFGGVEVPDAFIAFEVGGKKLAVLSQLEIARVRKEGNFDQCLSYEALRDGIREGGGSGTVAEIVATLTKKYGIKRFLIGYDFPAGLALKLGELGIKLELIDGLLFPERELKSDAEAAAIREGNRASAAGFKTVEKVLRAATVKRGKLFYEGRVLTSERLRMLIEIACIERGAIARHTIVAGGDQACDPHCVGSGPLRANELIIVDIFPRVASSGYHGDMTRTYLKGRASEAQRDLVDTVFQAQQEALPKHKSRAGARRIYDEVRQFFELKGYPTKVENGTPIGFFHGLGHGLGLEVHEPPRVSPAGDRLRKGQVITVEPGLYYPGLGGCRIEDVVRVDVNGPEMLSRHPYRWEFR